MDSAYIISNHLDHHCLAADGCLSPLSSLSSRRGGRAVGAVHHFSSGDVRAAWGSVVVGRAVESPAMLQTITWDGQGLKLLDQTKLPLEQVYVDVTSEKQMWH